MNTFFYRAMRYVTPILLLAGVTYAQDAVIQRAMRDEMQRNVKNLHLDTIAAPYFITYSIDDGQELSVNATLGGLLDSTTQHSRLFDVDVRIGSPKFDNTNFFSVGEGSGLRFSGGIEGTTLEDNYDALRRDLWIATDAAYKTAIEDLSKKKAAFENQTHTEDTIDFIETAPYTKDYPPDSFTFEKARWVKLVRSLSAIFEHYPEIQSSKTSIVLKNDESYYLNSEGSENTQPSHFVRITVTASTQASDGMPLSDFVSYNVPLPSDLPSDDAMKSAVDSMARRLTALRAAPVMDEYTGPVIFTGQASAEVFAQVFGDAMCSIRRPATDNPQMQFALQMLAPESPYANRIGSRILPDGFMVQDKPDENAINGVPTIGGAPIDDEGVPEQDVTLVDHGIMKTLLTCCTPHKKFATTNGHAWGIPARPAITNLIITDNKGESVSDLKSTLIEQCKARGLDYGVMITRLASPNIYNEADNDNGMAIFNRFFGGDGASEKITSPIVAYKVYTDGHEELVRGIQISGIGISDFKEMLAGGNEPYVYNTIIKTKSMQSFFSPFVVKPATIAAPSVLFDELSLKRNEGPFKKLPVVPSPLIGSR
ncbi:MAG TPA: metallopeptidase TldD-related protein [Candidatus Kapabacteria bacterium]|nr:metallopeptidase TldD-related protein [Candidatus Kapabacteria bacterium]